MEQISHRASRIGLFEADKPAGNLRQPRRDLSQEFAEKDIWLLGFRGELDGAKKSRGGLVEAAQTVAGNTHRQFQLSAAVDSFASLIQQEHRFREFLLPQQGLRGLEIECF